MLRQRAQYLCKYCHTQEKWQYVPFTVDHIVPIHLGEKSDIENLALACFHCNRHKSARITAFGPLTEVKTGLFNPRHQNWSEHFIWSNDRLRVVAEPLSPP